MDIDSHILGKTIEIEVVPSPEKISFKLLQNEDTLGVNDGTKRYEPLQRGRKIRPSRHRSRKNSVERDSKSVSTQQLEKKLEDRARDECSSTDKCNISYQKTTLTAEESNVLEKDTERGDCKEPRYNRSFRQLLHSTNFAPLPFGEEEVDDFKQDCHERLASKTERQHTEDTTVERQSRQHNHSRKVIKEQRKKEVNEKVHEVRPPRMSRRHSNERGERRNRSFTKSLQAGRQISPLPRSATRSVTAMTMDSPRRRLHLRLQHQHHRIPKMMIDFNNSVSTL